MSALDPQPTPAVGSRLEVLHVPDCPNLQPLLDRLREVTDAPVSTREVGTEAEAVVSGMAGSPTLLVNGTDPFAAPGQGAYGLSCRLYRDEHDRIVTTPSVAQLREAVAARTTPVPGEVLSAWRTRAQPLDPVEKAVHQAILRAFAATGRPPDPGDLGRVTAGTGRSTAEILAALHDLDAIRLAPDGRILVAYPFSATPTRHLVHLGDRSAGAIDVYAMCAVDALGMSAMLGQDTRIESVDVSTGRPVTVTIVAGRATWVPDSAVVFIGAAGGGPSADCCCDYLNFFTDTAAATAWATDHPQVPGQILTQAEAEALGTRLFRPLLADRS